MTIHKEGRKFLLTSFLILISAGWLSFAFLGGWAWFVVMTMTFFFLVFLQFFRHPDRKIPHFDDQLIYAPCDGKVVVIEEAYEGEFFDDRRIQVSIFMSPFNVHVNRYPFSGLVAYYKYHPGKFLVAWHPKSSSENERTTIVLENPKGHQVLLRQVAGALARRIIAYVKTGEQVKQGEELGFIKFGSRVDLYLPVGSLVEVGLEQVVVGNMTVIGRLPN
jgi:phosphatidylserine decarboxylase